MSKVYIPKVLRQRVAAEARHRCGYCLTQEAIVGTTMEIDHLIPESLGGLTEVDNLWLACSPCNDRKGDRIAARDPVTGAIVLLFDPRHQCWSEHVGWIAEGTEIAGQTPVGRATIGALSLNRPALVRSRRVWVAVGWHPPQD